MAPGGKSESQKARRLWPCVRRKSCNPAAKLPTVLCIGPGARRRLRALVQYTLVVLVVLILILWIGAEYQDAQARKAPDTISFYNLSEVCALEYDPDSQNRLQSSGNGGISMSNVSLEHPIVIETYDSVETAQAAEYTIVQNCGDCGQCSNPHDIKIYHETKDTLFASTVHCGKRGFVWGRKTASSCMAKEVGLTDGCNDCWVENIMCDLKKCLLVCMWHALFNKVDASEDSKTLNKCTICDEKRCGPDFVVCAGANRRRSAILSNIERDLDQEVCQAVDQGWWENQALQDYWDLTEQARTSQLVSLSSDDAPHLR